MLSSESGKNGLFIWACAGVLIAITILGNPYRYHQYNSGRYLVLSYRSLDSGLFRNDSVVDSLSRYRSLFYEQIGRVHGLFGGSVETLETTITILYGVFRGLTVVALLLLVQAGLAGSPREDRQTLLWSFVLMAGWACYPKTAFVGGIGLNLPTLSHQEIVFAMGLFALWFLLRGRALLFWALLAAAVFVHSLVALQLGMCAAPLFWERRGDRRFWLGGLLFGLSFLAYYFLMAPPPLGSDEGKVFLLAEQGSGHISLFNYRAPHWFAAIGMLVLAALAWVQFNRASRPQSVLLKMAATGAAFGIAISAIAVQTHSVKLALFQPLRFFYWVSFICAFLVILNAVCAMRTSQVAGILLLAPIALVTLESQLFHPFLALAIAFLLGRLILLGFSKSSQEIYESIARIGIGVMAMVIPLGWWFGTRQPIETLRAPKLVLPALACFAVLVPLSRRPVWHMIAAAVVFVFCMIAGNVQSQRFFAERYDADWESVSRWCRNHTQPADRFLTPPEKPNFRSLSLRTTLSERITQLSWVDPPEYLRNAAAADRAATGYGQSACDLEFLLPLAREWHCDYVITRGPLPERIVPRYRAGPYAVVGVQ